MTEKWEKLNIGIKIADRYQLIRKMQFGGGGPTFTGIILTNKRPVHLRFFSETEIPDMKSFNASLFNAKKAYKMLPANVSLPSDYGFHEEIPYVVHGISNVKTLHHFLQKTPKLKGKDVKTVIKALLEILKVIHQGEICHLGLSPIAIHQEEGGFLTHSISILDFGLTPTKGPAYFIRPGVDHELVSMAAYAAPEQASMSDAVDHRADLYTLGVLAYRILFGKPPFDGATTREIIGQVASREPPGLDETNTELDAAARGFLAKALQKDPQKRFQSAEEMLGFLQGMALEELGEEAVRPQKRPKDEEADLAPKHSPIVIFKVSEKDATTFEETSGQEVTAEIITQPTGMDSRAMKVAAAFKPRKAKDKTELFINLQAPLGGPESGAGKDMVEPAHVQPAEKEEPHDLSTSLEDKPAPQAAGAEEKEDKIPEEFLDFSAKKKEVKEHEVKRPVPPIPRHPQGRKEIIHGKKAAPPPGEGKPPERETPDGPPTGAKLAERLKLEPTKDAMKRWDDIIGQPNVPKVEEKRVSIAAIEKKLEEGRPPVPERRPVVKEAPVKEIPGKAAREHVQERAEEISLRDIRVSGKPEEQKKQPPAGKPQAAETPARAEPPMKAQPPPPPMPLAAAPAVVEAKSAEKEEDKYEVEKKGLVDAQALRKKMTLLIGAGIALVAVIFVAGILIGLNLKKSNEQPPRGNIEKAVTEPVETRPPAKTQPPVKIEPPVKTEPPAKTEPPVQAEPPVQTAPPVQVEPPVKEQPPVKTEPVKKVEKKETPPAKKTKKAEEKTKPVTKKAETKKAAPEKKKGKKAKMEFVD